MVTSDALEGKPATSPKRKRTRNGPVTTIRIATNDEAWSGVNRLVKVRALALAHNDRTRIVIMSPTCVLVGNRPRTH